MEVSHRYGNILLDTAPNTGLVTCNLSCKYQPTFFLLLDLFSAAARSAKLRGALVSCVTTVRRQWTMKWKQYGRKRLWPNMRYCPGSSWTDSGRPHKLCQDNLCSGRDAIQELWNTSHKRRPLALGLKGFCNSARKRHSFRVSERGAKNLALGWLSPSVSLDWQIDRLCVGSNQ
jgi:hypothetical protein